MLTLCLCHLRRLASAAEGRRMRRNGRRGDTVDLRVAALDQYCGILSERVRSFAAQIQMRQVHVEGHRAIERVGLIDNGLLASKGDDARQVKSSAVASKLRVCMVISVVDKVRGLKCCRPLGRTLAGRPLRAYCARKRMLLKSY
jgi:hypothetical protein